MTAPTATSRGGPAWTVDGLPSGRLLSGIQLRLLACAAVVLAATVSVAGDAGTRLAPLSVLGGLVVVAGTALAPTTPFPTLGLLLLAGVVVDRGPPLWLIMVIAGLLHAVHLLASWCAAVPPAARMQAVALLPTVRRWALAQVLTVPVAAGVALTAGDPSRSGALAVLGAVVLLTVSLLLVRLVKGRG